jgi:hypothetical protein
MNYSVFSLFVCSLLALAVPAFGQGYFIFQNLTAPTRVGSLDGPLAGTNFLALPLVGTNSSSLSPVGLPARHTPDGWVRPRLQEVPLSPVDFSRVFVQMAAWDGSLWGNDLQQVPPDQIGYTETLAVALTFSFQAHEKTWFTMPAVIPIPEPGLAGLFAFGFLLSLWLRHWPGPNRG